MKRPHFDPTVNLGHVITTLALIGSVFFAYTDIVRRIDNHEYRITSNERLIERSLTERRTFEQQILNSLTLLREDIATLKADNSRYQRDGDRK